MTITVRLATPADLPLLVPLYREMEVQYEGPAAMSEATIRSALERQVFVAEASASALIAEEANRLLGYAFISPLFPASAGTHALFIMDVFVSAAERSRGVGRALMQAVARRAAASGCSRVSWAVMRNNARALAFYASLGAQQREELVLMRLDGAALARLAAEGDQRATAVEG
jgi:GNAT superfamily N-acetyltransferase